MVLLKFLGSQRSAGPLAFGLVVASAVLAGAQEFPERRRSLDMSEFKSGSVILRAFSSVSTEARNHIVQFEREGDAVALGTIISAEGQVITKASEVKERALTAKLADGRTVPARLLRVDEENDVGLVQIEASDLSPIQWTTEELLVGQWAVTPGTGESPEAVGIISVPTRKILHRQAFIGVALDFRRPEIPEARILGTLPGLGAEQVGLIPGDVVLAVNGVPITAGQELIRSLRVYREGQTVALQIRRDEGEFEVSVPMMVPEDPPGGLDREQRMNRMGSELSGRADRFQQAIQHDSVLQSWQCGGPLLDLDGRAIGLNIARAGRVATYALPAALVEQVVEGLRARVPN